MRLRGALVTVAVLALALAPGAGAKSLGGLAAKDTPSGDTCSGCSGFQETTAPSSPSYKVPAGKWKITSWRTRNTTDEAVAARLWIFRPTKPGAYKLIARSDKETAGAHRAPSHRTSIKVRKGDRIGLESFGDMATFFGTSNDKDLPGNVNCRRHISNGQVVGRGTNCELFEQPAALVNVKATLKPR